MGQTNTIDIDVAEIPEYHRRKLAQWAFDLTDMIFSRPGEEEKYQAWLAERRKRQAADSHATA